MSIQTLAKAIAQAFRQEFTKNPLPVSGDGNGGGSGDATAANQQEIIEDTDRIENILYSVWDEDISELKVTDTNLSNKLDSTIGNKESNPATSDTGDFNLNSLFKRFLIFHFDDLRNTATNIRFSVNPIAAKFDKTLSEVVAAINNIPDVFPFKENEGIASALYTIPEREIANAGSFYSQLRSVGAFYRIVFERHKNLSGQYTVNCPPGGSISLEVQFSCAIFGEYSNASQDNLILTHTESGVYPFVLQNFAASIIRLTVVDVSGNASVNRLDYCMNY